MKESKHTAQVNGLYSFEMKQGAEGTKINGEKVHFDFVEGHDGLHALYNKKSSKVEVLELDREAATCSLLVNGQRYDVQLSDAYDELLAKMGIEKSGARKVKEVKAPMPGLVLEIAVNVGDEVVEGDTVLILEAMKMENALKSPVSGKVKAVHAKQAEAVEKGIVLVEFE